MDYKCIQFNEGINVGNVFVKIVEEWIGVINLLAVFSTILKHNICVWFLINLVCKRLAVISLKDG